MQFYLISALAFSLLVAIFAIQNTEMVVIKFLTWSFSISLVLVVLGAAVAGALVLYFLGLFKQVGSWIKIRQLNQRKNELENQVKKLESQLSEIKEKAEPHETTGNATTTPAAKPEQVQGTTTEDNSEQTGAKE